MIAEATAASTPLVGKTLAESNLRKLTGLSVIGIWKRGQYEVARRNSHRRKLGVDDDDMNVYLTNLLPSPSSGHPIISRATRERNVSTLHRAGADFVLSYASMGATAIFNYLRRAGVVVVAEGLHLAETRVPQRAGREDAC